MSTSIPLNVAPSKYTQIYVLKFCLDSLLLIAKTFRRIYLQILHFHNNFFSYVWRSKLYNHQLLNFATNLSEYVVFISFQTTLNHSSQKAVLIYNTMLL